MTELPPQCELQLLPEDVRSSEADAQNDERHVQDDRDGNGANHLRVGKHILWRCTEVVEWIEQDSRGPPPRRKPKMSESAEPEEPEDTADEDEEKRQS